MKKTYRIPVVALLALVALAVAQTSYGHTTYPLSGIVALNFDHIAVTGLQGASTPRHTVPRKASPLACQRQVHYK
jgi:hypothetical protein